MSVSVANGVRALAVLVVEDDFFVRCDIAGCLREAGYAVIETENGEDAIALCKSEMTIDMVFTDINLGGRQPDGMWLHAFGRRNPISRLSTRLARRSTASAVFPEASSSPSHINTPTF